MAGIAGIAEKDRYELITQSLSRIKHRGGSSKSIIKCPTATLGQLTPDSRQMWMGRSQDCNAVCDGSIYNWQELAPDAPDVNTAIERLYLEHGAAFVKMLDGPFALAIAGPKGLFLARGPMGVAPLYYGWYDGALCFASELKALNEWVTGIRMFPPGHYFCPVEGWKRYSKFTRKEAVDIPHKEAAAELRKRLDNAVAKAVALEDELGSWLSGGLDSSVMVALAARQVGKVQTFAAGTPGAPDLHFAKAVADAVGATHREVVVTTDEMLKVLPDVIYHLESFDALLVRSSITNYLVGKLASDYVPAVLSGEGGDELFGGYSYLKKLEPSALPDELVDITNRLHNTALQRVDRCSAAHGLSAHIAFLDKEVRNYALTIPVDYKIKRNGQLIEKWILRRAIDGLLPEDVVERPKAKFWEGAGVVNLIEQHANEIISDLEFIKESVLPDGSSLNSKEELFYYRIFKDHFGELKDTSCVGRSKKTPVTA